MQSNDDQGRPDPDPVDQAAAKIDARSPDAPEQIEELKELAESLGRDVDDPPNEPDRHHPTDR
jgi:hypothetical protein